jgi:hypothetical protein
VAAAAVGGVGDPGAEEPISVLDFVASSRPMQVLRTPSGTPLGRSTSVSTAGSRQVRGGVRAGAGERGRRCLECSQDDGARRTVSRASETVGVVRHHEAGVGWPRLDRTLTGDSQQLGTDREGVQ